MTRARELPPISDEEEARIQAGIAKDPDNPELTGAEFASMRPAREALPPALYAALTRDRHGRESVAGTEQITIALDRAVIDHFRAAGPGWPSLINETLRRAIGADETVVAPSSDT